MLKRIIHALGSPAAAIGYLCGNTLFLALSGYFISAVFGVVMIGCICYTQGFFPKEE